MGTSSSSLSKLDSAISVINSNFLDITNKTISTKKIDCVINQNQPIVIGSLNNCTVNAGQTTAIKSCKLNAAFKSSNYQDLKSLYSSAIETAAKNSSDAVMEVLAQPLSSTSSASITNVSQELKNIIDTKLTNETIENCLLKASVNQSQPFITGSCNGSVINIPQNAAIDASLSCFTDSVSNLIQSNSGIQQAMQDLDNSSKSKSSGLATISDSIMNGINGIFKTLGTAGTIIMVAIIIAVVFLGKSLFANPEAIKALSEASKGIYYF